MKNVKSLEKKKKSYNIESKCGFIVLLKVEYRLHIGSILEGFNE